jgi:hypothetical protein
MIKLLFFNSSLMSIHTTHHTYNIALTKKPFENIFYLRNSPVQRNAAGQAKPSGEEEPLVMALGICT